MGYRQAKDTRQSTGSSWISDWQPQFVRVESEGCGKRVFQRIFEQVLKNFGGLVDVGHHGREREVIRSEISSSSSKTNDDDRQQYRSHEAARVSG